MIPLAIEDWAIFSAEILTPVFVNKSEQSEFKNLPMKRRLALLRLLKRWLFVTLDGKLGSGRFFVWLA